MFLLNSIRRCAAEGRTAVIHKGGRMSYLELDRRSDAFAAYLLGLAGEKAPVLIYGHKEPDFLTCMYGSLKAGRAYVPIDISFPPDRLAQVIGEVRPGVVVDFTGTLGGAVDVPALEGIFKDLDGAQIGEDAWVRMEDTCYIIFTSGSTGKPKGVPISLRNLETMFASARDICRTGEGGVCLNSVSYSFDLSVIAVWVAVGLGMTLYTIDKKTTENFREMFDALRGSGITLWVTTPSYAEVCAMSADFCEDMLPELRTFFFCGEILTNKLAQQLLKRFPKAEVLNTYGPTEATVFVTWISVTEKEALASEALPVGRFYASVTPRIVDEAGREVPEGEKGLLQLIGDTVSNGYFGRPDLNAKAFFDVEINGTVKRGYNTGDICFMRGDMLHYCGRNDLQIKLNGFRIEIEDIEKNLMKLSSVKRAAVCPIYEDGKVSYLAAFILSEGDGGLPKLKRINELKAGLGELVPAYMIPRKFVLCGTFPTNASGKVDKKALLDSIIVE